MVVMLASALVAGGISGSNSRSRPTPLPVSTPSRGCAAHSLPLRAGRAARLPPPEPAVPTPTAEPRSAARPRRRNRRPIDIAASLPVAHSSIRLPVDAPVRTLLPNHATGFPRAAARATPDKTRPRPIPIAVRRPLPAGHRPKTAHRRAPPPPRRHRCAPPTTRRIPVARQLPLLMDPPTVPVLGFRPSHHDLPLPLNRPLARPWHRTTSACSEGPADTPPRHRPSTHPDPARPLRPRHATQETTFEMPHRDELFLAYRQAKAALFFERRGVGLLNLARFERDLPRRIDKLVTQLEQNDGWFDALPQGDMWVVPKKLHLSNDNPDHDSVVRIADQPLPAQVRGLDVQIRFTPSPEYAIVEVLFLWQFGPLLESLLSANTLGYRLDLRQGRLKSTRRWLFQYWPKRYEQYRNTVLDAATREVDAGNSVLLLCADLTSFYDTIDPRFLATDQFFTELQAATLDLPDDQLRLLEKFPAAVTSLIRSYTRFQQRASRITGYKWSTGVPIGALTSRVIANVALGTLDREIESLPVTRCYKRYVDDFALVALADHIDTNQIGKVVQQFIPHVEQKGEKFHLDGVALKRGQSQFQIQERKCKAYHISGSAGRGFLRGVRADFGRLVSKGRSFLDPAILQADKLPNLVRAGYPGRRLTVLRDIDRLRLEHFELAIRYRSLERMSILVDGAEAAKLVRRAAAETVRFLSDSDNWVENLEVTLRLLRIAVRTGDWPHVEELLAYMDRLWGDNTQLRRTARRLFCGGNAIQNQSAFTFMRNYLHARRVEAVCSAVLPLAARELPASLQDGIVERTQRTTWRALVGRGRILAAADLRTFDREDDRFDHGDDSMRWRQSADFGLHDNELGQRLQKIGEFARDCQSRGDSAWGMPAPRLFLCTRPPSYFDIARRVLHSIERGVQEHIFRDLLELVNAIRGTEYRDVVGERRDEHTVIVPKRSFLDEAGLGDPQLMLGNLPVSEACYHAAATRVSGSPVGRPLLTVHRLNDVREVLEQAARKAARYTEGPSLLVLPELSLPRTWFREVAKYVTKLGGYGLIVGLEYLHDVNEPWVLNQVYAVLPGPLLSAAVWPWTKRHAAREEAAALGEHGVVLRPNSPSPESGGIVVVSPYGDVSVLICSELIEARRVADLLRRVEVLAVPAWNRDTASYDHLLKSAGLQLFAVVGVANNGVYSDCRAWAPRMIRWERDLCRHIERESCGVVAVRVPLRSLREWRETGWTDDKRGWKALPPDWSW